MKQYTLEMNPLPPPPPPKDNVFYYGVTYTEVEEYEDSSGLVSERVTGKEITIRKFYCEYAEFNKRGYCFGCDTPEHDQSYCMQLSKINEQKEVAK